MLDGRRRVRGRGRERCPRERIPVRLETMTNRLGGFAPATPRTLYLGEDAEDVPALRPRRRPAVVIRTLAGRRLRAMWWVNMSCANRLPGLAPARPEPFINYTPTTRIQPNGRFRRQERFRIRYDDALYRYKVVFGGRFTKKGARGRLLAVLAIYTPDGRRQGYLCRSFTRPWRAVRQGAVTQTPPVTRRTARGWSLQYGYAQPFPGSDRIEPPSAFGPPSPLTLTHDRTRLAFAFDPGSGIPEDGVFAAGRTAVLSAGRTYVDDNPELLDTGGAVLDAIGCSSGGSVGRFTVTRADYDLFGFPTAFDASFEERCGSPSAVPAVGTFSFRR